MISLKSKSMLFSNKYIRKKGMFMKRKIKSVKGFTLAELLIVVAIIAVLVAIGIPIFTSQLEKSREAVDLSDVRSAYAEVPRLLGIRRRIIRTMRIRQYMIHRIVFILLL